MLDGDGIVYMFFQPAEGFGAKDPTTVNKDVIRLPMVVSTAANTSGVIVIKLNITPRMGAVIWI